MNVCFEGILNDLKQNKRIPKYPTMDKNVPMISDVVRVEKIGHGSGKRTIMPAWSLAS